MSVGAMLLLGLAAANLLAIAAALAPARAPKGSATRAARPARGAAPDPLEELLRDVERAEARGGRIVPPPAAARRPPAPATPRRPGATRPAVMA
jgi:hypothetical protein